MPDLIEGAGYEPTEAVDATTVSLLDEKNVDTEGPPSEETIVRWIKADIDDAEELQDELREIRRQCYQLYRGKNADKEREGRSNIVSTEIMNAVEWVIPSLMRIYFQSDQIVVCEGMGPEDVPKGEQMTRVLNDMFTRRQGGFIKCLKWFKDALVYGLGAGKITWEEEFQESELYYKELPEDAFDLLTSDPTIHVEHYVVEEEEQETAGLGKLATMFGIPSQPSEPLVRKTYSDVRVTEAVKTYEGIAFEVLPLEDYLYDPKAEDTGDCDYQIHRVELSIDECLRREEEGIYKNVDELISIAQTGQEPNDGRGDAEKAERYAENNRTDPNSISTTNDPDQIGRQKVTVYEWWGDLDIDGTGKLKPYVVAVCEDVLIRCDPNPYNHQNPPFVTLRPMLDIHTFEGIGMADLLKEEQQTLTAITRQYLDNLSWQNNGMWETDRNARVEMSSLLKPRPGGVVRTDRIGSVKSLAPPDIASQALQGIEFMRDACQAKSGVTRYSQGLDADALNKRIDISTPVPMFDGTWKLLKDIEDGDVIIGGDGKATTVKKAHEISMSEGAYDLTFSNGAKIKADAEHLWGVYVWDRYRVYNSRELFELHKAGKPVRVSRPERIYAGESKDLPIDPYVFGCWLGDGHSHSARITTMDQEIVSKLTDWVKSQGWEIHEHSCQNSGKAITYEISAGTDRRNSENGRFESNDSFYSRLSDLGQLPRYGGYKHIPSMYLEASYEQRLSLLRGIMDTDGCWGSNGIAILSSTSDVIVDMVMALVRSLGGYPHKTVSRKAIEAEVNGQMCNCKKAYHVCFNLNDCPFSIERKVSIWKAPQNNKTYKIVHIEESEDCLMRCLTVDNPDGLWLVGPHYITTHNTATGITAIMSKSDARIELIARTFAETGVRDLFVMANSLVQQFMTMDYSVRVYGEPIQVAPDDVKGNFDIIVSVGTNPGRQEQIAQQMLQLINMSGALMQNGVMTADNMYQIVIKLLECWGHKDTEHYLTDPQVMQQMQGTIQGLRQQIIQLTGVDPFGQQQQQPGNAGGGPGGPGIPGQMPAGGSGGPPGAPQTLSG